MNFKKKILVSIFIIIILLFVPVVYSNNSSNINDSSLDLENNNTLTALESGDSNISFSDGYTGYCIEWGEKSANVGDQFFVSDDDVDNNLKTFFVYFYDESQKDVVSTQHMIWKFSDGKEFSRFNQSLYDRIVEKSSVVCVPNEGSVQFNSSHWMFFSFHNLIAQFDDYQNYFVYKIYFSNESSIIINNSSVNNFTNYSISIYDNLSMVLFNKSYDKEVNILTIPPISYYTELYETGQNLEWTLGCIIFLIIMSILFYKE